VYYQNDEKHVDKTYQFGMVTDLVKNYYEDGKLLRKVTTGEIASTASIQAIIPMVSSRNRASESRKFKRPFPPPAALLPPARPRAAVGGIAWT